MDDLIMMLLELTFWTALGLIAYCYLGYPLLLAAWTSVSRSRPADRGPSGCGGHRSARDEWPFVSLIIAAYKEESIILQRVQNALEMDYPADRLEILIGCDGNEDTTGDLVRTVDDPRVRLLQFPQRRGKPSVLNDCIDQARGEILAFSDANTFWNRDAMKTLVRHFDGEQVGGVCGQLLLTDPETGANVDGLYWRYENFLKRCEGRLGTLLGVNGAIYAIRRDLWEPIPANSIVDDFLIGMRVHLHRRKLLFEESAIAHEESAPTMQAEFHRRARIGAGGFQSLGWLLPLLNPLRGRVACAFWSHKVMRWFCPLLMLTVFVSNAFLLTTLTYQLLFIGQCLFYLGAVAGRYVPGRGIGSRMVRLTSMFLSMNLALAVGFWRWLGNRQSGAWKRTARTGERTRRAEERVNALNEHGTEV
jgi:cellulose synthase/poly-beta-1,6-N-acetylglucosamine synthase-like glycosyltransferase